MGSGWSYSLGYKGFRDGVVTKDHLLRGQKAQSLADTRNSMCDVMKTQNMGRRADKLLGSSGKLAARTRTPGTLANGTTK